MTIEFVSTKRRVEDVAKVISGYAFKSKDFQDKGIPVIKIKNIRKGYVDLTDTQYVDNEFLSLDKKYYVKNGDILISLTGSHLTQPESVVKSVTKEDVHGIEVIEPSKEVLNRFTKIIQSVFRELEILINKNNILRKIRDLLLPKLISGEIDVEKININGPNGAL